MFLAALCSVNPNTVRGWLNGRAPNVVHAATLAHAFECRVEDLLVEVVSS